MKNFSVELDIPKKGLLTYLTPDYQTVSLAGEFSLELRPDGAYNIIARKRGGRNRWNLCSVESVVNFREGAGWEGRGWS